jgi:glycerol-3-phosphate dehydrogenase (NAD+)
LCAQVDGKNLTEIINETHENVKYLPGVKLPENVVAVPDLKEAAAGATLLIFVVPHQFLGRLLPQLAEVVGPNTKAISLAKGIDFDDNGVVLISDIIRRGLKDMDVSVLMGANVANEVAQDQFCETTVGCKVAANAALWKLVFNAKYFRVETVQDTAGVELCGAMKNIVALGAGFCDGLGYGGNTKAAIIRIGLIEMQRFCAKYYEGVEQSTFFESCGVADLITTCYGGRNRKCAEAFAKGGKTWDELETEMLNGQKLQGTLTSKEVHEVLVRQKGTADFPLFEAIYKIAFEGVPCEKIVEYDSL